MGEGSATRPYKSREDGDADGPFLLSDFPDEVLCRIISFLPLKDAVRTGLLSKRWQHLWHFDPRLEYSEDEFPERSTFMNFMERILLLGGSSSVETFHLYCDVKSDTARINSWITAVVGRRVQDMYLRLRLIQQPGALPSCLFRCESLVRLTLDMPNDLILPSSVRLSSLKKLTLEQVRFVDSASVQNLFSSPALESISIYYCHWANLNNVTVSAPNLQTLTIRDSYFDGKRYGQCRVVINGRNLKLFSYTGDLRYGYSAVGSSSFDKAEVSVNRGQQGVSAVRHASTLLEALYNVRSLTLSGQFLKSVSGEGDSFELLPTFCNMTELKLNVQRVIELDLMLLAKLLRKCDCLRKLEIEGFFRFKDCDVTRALEPVPPCFVSELKKIAVRPFSPTKVNLHCVGLLLFKAMVLEDMVLQYEEKIKLPGSSKNCKISFTT